MKQRLWVVPLALLACSEFTFVGPTSHVKPQLVVSVQTMHDEQLSYVVQALFRNGTDVNGRPLALSDSALLVQGSTVQPKATQRNELSYSWNGNAGVVAAAPESLTIRSPVLAGAGTPCTIASTTFTMPIPVRLDSVRTTHPAGTELRLNMSPQTETEGGVLRRTTWLLQIRVHENQPSLLLLQGASAPPVQLRVPWEWLADSVLIGDSLLAEFRSASHYDFSDGPPSTCEVRPLISVSVDAIARMVWRLSIVAPANR